MRTSGAKGRLLGEEGGFTLPEMLVTIMVMTLVLFGLYSIFDMSLRVFDFGNDKVEAAENARLGLEKIERELRSAYPVDRNNSAQRHLFFNATGSGSAATPYSGPFGAANPVSQITFGNDLGAGDGRVQCPNPAGVCEYITYKLSSSTDPSAACTSAPCTLRRVNTAFATDPGEPVVDYVVPGGLTFQYLKSDGGIPANEAQVGKVLVRLEVNKDGRIQELTTEVDLRSRP